MTAYGWEEDAVARCFVIQPFDRGPFDKRYDDVVAPAIQSAGLEPYRVDRDPAASVLIDSIEQGIKSASLCVADITSENPNVWYELGFAFAAGKQVVMVRSRDRATKFPFDVQHRSILVYSTESSSDFEKFGRELTERIKAALRKNEDLETLASPILRAESGLAPHEVACLAVVMENTLSSPMTGIHQILQDMDRAGFTRTAVGVAVRSLAKKRLLDVAVESDRDDQTYQLYSLTAEGEDWLVSHQSELTLTSRADNPSPSGGPDEIPF
jgi:hypothetical protein